MSDRFIPSRPRPRRSLGSTDPAVVLDVLNDPDTVAGVGLDALVKVLHTARGRAFGLPRTSTPAQQAPYALVALAAVRVLLDQLAASRWPWARDALELGAPTDEVAAALGLDVDEVRAGLLGHGFDAAAATLDAGRPGDAS